MGQRPHRYLGVGLVSGLQAAKTAAGVEAEDRSGNWEGTVLLGKAKLREPRGR